MPGLLYYVPGRKTASLKDIAELGLQYAFERDLTARGCRGPDGADGIVIADATRVTDLGYYAGRQEWRKIAGNAAGAWVGRGASDFGFRISDLGLVPSDLAREEQLRGHLVRLADGQEWLVPIARGLSEEDGDLRWYYAVPRRMALGEDGQWAPGDVLDRYRELWLIACQWWDAIRGEALAGDFFATDQARIEAAIAVLGQNYRLAAAEVSLLGLFEERSAEAILMAIVDWKTLEEWTQKKTREAEEKARPAAS